MPIRTWTGCGNRLRASASSESPVNEPRYGERAFCQTKRGIWQSGKLTKIGHPSRPYSLHGKIFPQRLGRSRMQIPPGSSSFTPPASHHQDMDPVCRTSELLRHVDHTSRLVPGLRQSPPPQVARRYPAVLGVTPPVPSQPAVRNGPECCQVPPLPTLPSPAAHCGRLSGRE